MLTALPPLIRSSWISFLLLGSILAGSLLGHAWPGVGEAYDGWMVTGWPIATVVSGQVVMQDDTVIATPRGRPLTFLDAATPQRGGAFPPSTTTGSTS